MKNYSIETWFRSLEDLQYGMPKIKILTKCGITDERILLRWKGDFENRVYTEAALRKVSENLQTAGGVKKLENPLLEKFWLDKIAVGEQGNR